MENENLEQRKGTEAEQKEATRANEVKQPKGIAHAKAVVRGRSKLILGGTAVLIAGMILGFAATRFGAGISNASAATRNLRSSSPAAATPANRDSRQMAWNPFQQISDMQLQMDQMFNQMASQFHMVPSLNAFAESPGYSLSLRVRDMKDHYEVRAYLPNAKASDVQTSLLDKQTLKVEVSNKTSKVADQKGAKEAVSEWGQYAQIIHLPGPVKSEEIKIDQPNHQLLITLPKA